MDDGVVEEGEEIALFGRGGIVDIEENVVDDRDLRSIPAVITAGDRTGTVRGAPVLMAVHESAARSEPALGSLHSSHQNFSALAIGGRNSFLISSDPTAMRVGPSMLTPKGSRPGHPLYPMASASMTWSVRSPEPPYSFGHDRAIQPLLPISLAQYLKNSHPSFSPNMLFSPTMLYGAFLTISLHTA